MKNKLYVVMLNNEITADAGIMEGWIIPYQSISKAKLFIEGLEQDCKAKIYELVELE